MAPGPDRRRHGDLGPRHAVGTHHGRAEQPEVDAEEGDVPGRQVASVTVTTCPGSGVGSSTVMVSGAGGYRAGTSAHRAAGADEQHGDAGGERRDDTLGHSFPLSRRPGSALPQVPRRGGTPPVYHTSGC